MFKSRPGTRKVRQSSRMGHVSKHFPFSTLQSRPMGKKPKNSIKVRKSEMNSTKPRGESRARPSTYSGLSTPWPKMRKTQSVTKKSKLQVHKPTWKPGSARSRQSQLSALPPNVRDVILNQRINRAIKATKYEKGTHATVGHSTKGGQRVVVTSP